MNGQSYQAAFEAGLAMRVKRTPTARQLYLSWLVYTPVKVNRWGQVEIDTWTYGAPDTQEDLLPYHRKSEAILLGRDPDNFEALAMAWNAKDELTCEFVQPVKRGACGSVDGIRQAATNRKAAREAVSAAAAAAAANNYLSDAERKAALAAIPTPGAPSPTPTGRQKPDTPTAVTQTPTDTPTPAPTYRPTPAPNNLPPSEPICEDGYILRSKSN